MAGDSAPAAPIENFETSPMASSTTYRFCPLGDTTRPYGNEPVPVATVGAPVAGDSAPPAPIENSETVSSMWFVT